MTPEFVLSLASNALITALLIASPMLAVGLVVGVSISLFQAVTQINEVSLAFIPKIITMILSLLLFSGWMLAKLISLSHYLFGLIPEMVH